MMLFLMLFLLFGVKSLVSDNTFDHFVLAQQWPISVCIGNNLTIPPPHLCRINKNVTGWEIHGLWPTRNKTHEPLFCNKSSTFNLTRLRPIMADLQKYWTNLYADTSAKDFWEHEWLKHGTCATSISQFCNEYHYFKGTLALHNKFNLTRILANSGIVPSTRHYQDTDLLMAMQKNSEFQCYYDKTTGIQFLSSIQICLSKSLQWIDCPSYATVSKERHVRSNAHTHYDNMLLQHFHMIRTCSDTVPIVYPKIHPV